MANPHVVILGAGAAGAAAVRTLLRSPKVDLTLVGRTGETPYNRTLVDKGVAVGVLSPDQIALPPPGVVLRADTAESVQSVARVNSHGAGSRPSIRLASGAELKADSVVVATGSVPRLLDLEIPGVGDALRRSRIITLHSLEDAVVCRDTLAFGPARVVILGGGLLASELCTLLLERGHKVTMVARSPSPGAAAFGPTVARHLAEVHDRHLDTRFGRLVVQVQADDAEVVLTLDDASEVCADLVAVAHGTRPVGPSPWLDGLEVDGRLRARNSRCIYGAGGVAWHTHAVAGTWRIDHWAESIAQGEHAARTVLSDLGLAEDPGDYLPRTPHSLVVHGTPIMAAGITGQQTHDRVVNESPLVVVHDIGGTPVGVTGVDAPSIVLQWLSRLHSPVRR